MILVPSAPGDPKFGVLSEFQFTFCAIVYLVPSHAPALLASAWYTFQISVPSGLWKNLQYVRNHVRVELRILDVPIVTCAIISVCRGQKWPSLHPACGFSWVPAIPGQEPQLIAGGPAVARTVCQISLSTVVHCNWPLINWVSNSLPGFRRLGYNSGGSNWAWRIKWCDTERLEPGAAKAGIDKVVGRGGAEDGAVNSPSVH